MQQISMFLFDPQIAYWKKAPWSDSDQTCEVLALIPHDVLGPLERKNQRLNSVEWQEQQKVWSSYVRAISTAIPMLERSKDDINGWNRACHLLVMHRDKRQPIKMKFWKSEINSNLNTEVVDYLIASDVRKVV